MTWEVTREAQRWHAILRTRAFLERLARSDSQRSSWKVKQPVRAEAFKLLYKYPEMDDVREIILNLRNAKSIDDVFTGIWEEFTTGPPGFEAKLRLKKAIERVIEEDRRIYRALLAKPPRPFCRKQKDEKQEET